MRTFVEGRNKAYGEHGSGSMFLSGKYKVFLDSTVGNLGCVCSQNKEMEDRFVSSGETCCASSLNLHRSERQWGQKRRKTHGKSKRMQAR